MNSLIYRLFFVILIYIKSIQNYPNGAPPEACPTMTPQHNVNSQQCSTKYQIQSDKSQYYTNDTVRITVSGSTSNDIFEGVLLIAKTETSGQIIGNWTAVSLTLQPLSCGGIANTGVTHISNDGKTSVVAIWSPPSTVSSENTVIRATIVTNYSTIYVNCFSVTLTPRENVQSGNGTNTTTVTNSISTILSTSTTALTTTTTPTTDVTVNITWTYTNGITAVKMRINNLKTSQWLGLGLSLDQSMGEDHVFVCKRLANDTVTVERYINPSGHTPAQPVSSGEGGTFNKTLEKLDNGVADCEFTLSNFGSSKRRRRSTALLSQSTAYYPLIASGNLDSSNELIQHTFYTALPQTVQLNLSETIVYNIDSSNYNGVGLMKAHGIIMIFTWILFVSTGILLARYFKPSWPERKICGKPIWFAIHRALMTSVAALTIIAFILILVYEKGKWISQNTQPNFAHSIIGILVICFAVIQPIMALFRCKPDAKYRFIFNYGHAFVGLTAFILSIVAIFLAMFISQFNFQANKEWGIMVAWACWVLIIFIIFWFIEFYFRKNGSKEENPDSYDLGNSQSKNEQTPQIYNATQDRIKLAFLIIHILVALGIALALAILVGTS